MRCNLNKEEIAQIMKLHRQGASNKLIAERLGYRSDDGGLNRIRRVVKRERARDDSQKSPDSQA